MLVLALETATEAAGVALADDDGILAALSLERGRRHGESVAPAIEFLCRRVGVTLAQLDALCVDAGPGLFTGLRVGVSTAKALGFALGIPVVEMTSLEVLALELARSPWADPGGGCVLQPVVDARRALVFSARYGLAGGEPPLVRVGDEALFEPEALASELALLVEQGRRCLCPGDGARRYGELLAGVGAEPVPSVVFPDVAVLAAAGLARAAAGEGRPAPEVTARYLRPADVRINWERRMSTRPVAGS